MTIKRISDFPEGSGSLTSDDIFLIMDDPSGSATTKKVSLSTLSNILGNGGGGGNANTGDITFNGTTISTANTDQSMTITTNGNGDIYIGADRNMIFDMNAFSAKGILLQDSQEDGYDNPETPSTLKVGSIYHQTGTMVIQSDGSIVNSSGVQVDTNGDPTNTPVYGGLLLTNKDNSAGLYINPSTQASGTVALIGRSLTLDNNTSLAKGTFDNNTGGQSGISLNCAVGYELNWQGGHLKSTSDNGTTAATIQVDSPVNINTNNGTIGLNGDGISFSDGTSQNSAGVTSKNTGINGASRITNMVSISQNDYDALGSYDANTLYIIS